MKRIASGIVMEIKDNIAVLMTNNGEFVNVKKPSPYISLGEEVTSTVIDVPSISWVKYASIAAAIMIMFIPFVYFKEAYATVAYINVDINPSLEIGINKYNKVNEIIPLNEDAKVLLEDISLKNLDINEALGKVITTAKDKGYIKEDKENNIDISLVKLNEGKVNITQESLAKCVKDIAPALNADTTVEIHKANKKIHDEAKKENISTNKYLEKSEDKDKDPVKVDLKKDVPSKNNEVKDKNEKDDKKNMPKNSPEIKDKGKDNKSEIKSDIPVSKNKDDRDDEKDNQKDKEQENNRNKQKDTKK